MPKNKAGDLYLASNVQVVREPKKGEAPKPTHIATVMHPEPTNIVTIPAGQFVSETDLTDEEIEGLKRHGVLRVGTAAEIEAAESREDNKSAAEAIRASEQEAKDLAANQKLEKDQLDAKQKADAQEEQRKLDEAQAKERDAAAAKAAGSGKSKAKK